MGWRPWVMISVQTARSQNKPPRYRPSWAAERKTIGPNRRIHCPFFWGPKGAAVTWANKVVTGWWWKNLLTWMSGRYIFSPPKKMGEDDVSSHFRGQCFKVENHQLGENCPNFRTPNVASACRFVSELVACGVGGARLFCCSAPPPRKKNTH